MIRDEHPGGPFGYTTKRRGLRTASARYLSDYLLPGMPLPPLSLETILIAAGAVEELLRGKLPSKERNRRQRAAANSK